MIALLIFAGIIFAVVVIVKHIVAANALLDRLLATITNTDEGTTP